MASEALEVMLAAPLKILRVGQDGERDGAQDRVVHPGARVELALRQRAGEADGERDVLTEVRGRNLERGWGREHKCYSDQVLLALNKFIFLFREGCCSRACTPRLCSCRCSPAQL